MAIPVSYNLLSAKERWTSSVVAVLGIAGTVGVFVAMLALARQASTSGKAQNASGQRSGADDEMTGAITLEEVRIVEDAPQIARGPDGPLVSAEVVVIAAIPMRGEDGEANVQVRGVSPRVLAVRDNVKLVEGRFLKPGLAEAVVGKGARDAYQGRARGATVRLGAGTWTIVGVFDGKGTAFNSEVWADAATLNGFYQRPPSISQAATVRLRSADDFPAFEATLKGDPRLNLQALREQAYYEKQSVVVTTLITVLGSLVAAVMALGAVFGALNTMYSAVSERSREIAVLRALGFGGGAIVLSFFVESLLIAFVGGLVGCVAVLPVNGLTTGTINWQTFSHLAFAFRITPDLLALGMLFALVMGAVGGLPPAIRAARANVAHRSGVWCSEGCAASDPPAHCGRGTAVRPVAYHQAAICAAAAALIFIRAPRRQVLHGSASIAATFSSAGTLAANRSRGFENAAGRSRCSACGDNGRNATAPARAPGSGRSAARHGLGRSSRCRGMRRSFQRAAQPVCTARSRPRGCGRCGSPGGEVGDARVVAVPAHLSASTRTRRRQLPTGIARTPARAPSGSRVEVSRRAPPRRTCSRRK